MTKNLYDFNETLVRDAEWFFINGGDRRGRRPPKGMFHQYMYWFFGTDLTMAEIAAQLGQTKAAVSSIHRRKFEPFFGARKYKRSTQAKQRMKERKEILRQKRRAIFPEGSPASEAAELARARGLNVQGILRSAKKMKVRRGTLIINDQRVSVTRVTAAWKEKQGILSATLYAGKRMRMSDFLIILLQIEGMPSKNFIVPARRMCCIKKKTIYALLSERRRRIKTGVLDLSQYEGRWDLLAAPCKNESPL